MCMSCVVPSRALDLRENSLLAAAMEPIARPPLMGVRARWQQRGAQGNTGNWHIWGDASMAVQLGAPVAGSLRAPRASRPWHYAGRLCDRVEVAWRANRGRRAGRERQKSERKYMRPTQHDSSCTVYAADRAKACMQWTHTMPIRMRCQECGGRRRGETDLCCSEVPSPSCLNRQPILHAPSCPLICGRLHLHDRSSMMSITLIIRRASHPTHAACSFDCSRSSCNLFASLSDCYCSPPLYPLTLVCFSGRIRPCSTFGSMTPASEMLEGNPLARCPSVHGQMSDVPLNMGKTTISSFSAFTSCMYTCSAWLFHMMCHHHAREGSGQEQIHPVFGAACEPNQVSDHLDMSTC